MKTLTQRCLLALFALALFVGAQAAWAVPPCTLCPWLSSGHICFLPNGEYSFCPTHYQVEEQEQTLEAFLEELEAMDEATPES